MHISVHCLIGRWSEILVLYFQGCLRICQITTCVLIESQPSMPLVSALKDCRALELGGEGYLIYAIDISTSIVGIEDISVVCEFSDIFPHEIPSFPPVREVDFSIE